MTARSARRTLRARLRAAAPPRRPERRARHADLRGHRGDALRGLRSAPSRSCASSALACGRRRASRACRSSETAFNTAAAARERRGAVRSRSARFRATAAQRAARRWLAAIAARRVLRAVPGRRVGRAAAQGLTLTSSTLGSFFYLIVGAARAARGGRARRPRPRLAAAPARLARPRASSRRPRCSGTSWCGCGRCSTWWCTCEWRRSAACWPRSRSRSSSLRAGVAAACAVCLGGTGGGTQRAFAIGTHLPVGAAARGDRRGGLVPVRAAPRAKAASLARWREVHAASRAPHGLVSRSTSSQ